MLRQNEKSVLRWTLLIAFAVPVVFSAAGHCCCAYHEHSCCDSGSEACNHHHQDDNDCDCCCECDEQATGAVGDFFFALPKRCCEYHPFVVGTSGLFDEASDYARNLSYDLSLRRIPVLKLRILHCSWQI